MKKAPHCRAWLNRLTAHPLRTKHRLQLLGGPGFGIAAMPQSLTLRRGVPSHQEAGLDTCSIAC